VITDQMGRTGSRTEPAQPTGPPLASSKRWLKALAFTPLLVIALLQLVVFFKIHAREQLLAERGLTTSAVVVGTDYHGDTVETGGDSAGNPEPPVAMSQPLFRHTALSRSRDLG
jgi:hypothetical protein